MSTNRDNMVMRVCPGILFDLDGVVIDSEPIYDIFWKDVAIRYNIGIKDFHKLIKGTTMPNILDKYFSNYTQAERDRLNSECMAFESTMDLPEVEGCIRFITQLKEAGFPTGLVTSSDSEKVKNVFNVLSIQQLFDIIVTSEQITNGKPHPDCYLLAAKKLHKKASQCLIFEDSINGIKAGNAAGARVIGVTTTNSREILQPITFATIPNFNNLSIEQIKVWSKDL